MRSLKLLNMTGDTIVEVLIAIGIVSIVLVGAYSSATRSFNNSRQSQERGEALKFAQTQLEKIKAFASKPTKNVYESGNVYCFDSSDNQQKFNAPTYDPFSVSTAADDFSKYPTGCVQAFYHVAVKYIPNTPGPPASKDDFVILVRWNRLGSGNDEIKMHYRLSQ